MPQELEDPIKMRAVLCRLADIAFNLVDSDGGSQDSARVVASYVCVSFLIFMNIEHKPEYDKLITGVIQDQFDIHYKIRSFHGYKVRKGKK